MQGGRQHCLFLERSAAQVQACPLPSSSRCCHPLCFLCLQEILLQLQEALLADDATTDAGAPHFCCRRCNLAQTLDRLLTLSLTRLHTPARLRPPTSPTHPPTHPHPPTPQSRGACWRRWPRPTRLWWTEGTSSCSCSARPRARSARSAAPPERAATAAAGQRARACTACPMCNQTCAMQAVREADRLTRLPAATSHRLASPLVLPGCMLPPLKPPFSPLLTVPLMRNWGGLITGSIGTDEGCIAAANQGGIGGAHEGEGHLGKINSIQVTGGGRDEKSNRAEGHEGSSAATTLKVPRVPEGAAHAPHLAAEGATGCGQAPRPSQQRAGEPLSSRTCGRTS